MLHLVGSLAIVFTPSRSIFGQTQSERSGFEVASVKPLQGMIYRANMLVSGTRVTTSGPLNNLIQIAYGFKDYQIFGGPKWASAGDVLFEVIAKAEGSKPPTREVARQMLQKLLADRFQLVVHRETKEIAVYELVVAKKGPRMRRAPEDAKFDVSVALGPKSRIAATASMASLSIQFNRLIVDRPVVDNTGLSGLFEFTLEWSPEGGSVDGILLPSLFTAVEEQLGLKLQPARRPMDVLVIDHAERPSAN